MLEAHTMRPIVLSRSLRQTFGVWSSSPISCKSLMIFFLRELDGVVIEVYLPTAPLDAGFALGLFPADGCVDHLHEDHHQGEALTGLGSPKGCQNIIHVKPSFVWHEAEKAVDVTHQEGSHTLPPIG